MLGSILVLYPPDARSIPRAVTTKNVIRRCQISPGRKNHPQLKTTALEGPESWAPANSFFFFFSSSRFYLFIYLLIFIMIDLQCSIHFRCTAKGRIHTYTYILFLTSSSFMFHYK